MPWGLNPGHHSFTHLWNIFEHTYLTMSSITLVDALIKAADNHVDTISGLLPKNSITADAVEQPMEIYKIQAKKATCKAQTQRVLWEQAQAQRVEAQQIPAEQQASPQNSPTLLPNLKVYEHPNPNTGTLGTPIISQDNKEDISTPAPNTCQQQQIHTLTPDYMLHMI